MTRRHGPAKLLATLSVTALSVLPDHVPVVHGYEDEVCSNELHSQLPADIRNRCCRHDDSLPTIDEVARVDKLERVSCNITREYFLMKYEMPRQPVMLVGCDESWPARKRWTPEKLVSRFTNESKWRAKFESSGDFRHRAHWGDIVDAMSDPDRFFYVFDSFEDVESRKLDQDFVQPKPTQGINMYASDGELLSNFPSGFGLRRWWFFGRGESGTYPHYDPHETDAWLTTIQGHKWWVVYPETMPRTFGSTEAASLDCNESCSFDDVEVRDWFASVGKYAEHENYDGKHPFHILQRAGETLYVPAGFAHAVYNMDDTVGVTSNWASPYNLENVWEFVLEKGGRRVRRKFYNGLSPELREAVDRMGHEWDVEDEEDDDEEDD